MCTLLCRRVLTRKGCITLLLCRFSHSNIGIVPMRVTTYCVVFTVVVGVMNNNIIIALLIIIISSSCKKKNSLRLQKKQDDDNNRPRIWAQRQALHKT